MAIFNAHHAPIGAYATFTLGGAGRAGGVRIGSGHPPRQDIFVGACDPSGAAAMPFFAHVAADPVRAIPHERIGRTFGPTSDSFSAEGITLRIRSPLGPVPEPGIASETELRDGLLPAVLLELRVDNGAGAAARRGFLGLRPGFPVSATASPAALRVEDSAGRITTIACSDGWVTAAAGTDLASAIDGTPGGSGGTGVLRFDVPAGGCAVHRLAVAFWHAGTVASGPDLDCSYWYTSLFEGPEDVVAHALARFDLLAARWDAAAAALEAAALSADQRFLLAHAVHSYYGNTALLRTGDGRPLWAVMEGEFAFVNTLDLTVDQLFFELRQSPWTVRNVLDTYLERGAYRDCRGLGFGHDLGLFPALAPPGSSAYEQPRRPGRTVLMTSEECTNWLLTALVYVAQTGDDAWATRRHDTFVQCLRAIIARDTGGGGARDGLISADTERTGPYGEEITTFDALDPSLRLARRSAYLATKQWAACAALEHHFEDHGDPSAAAVARDQATVIARGLQASAVEHGFIPGRPAADGEDGDLTEDLPLVECLVYALYAGLGRELAPGGEHHDFAALLERHLAAVLRPGACLFPDGGWKLSAHHDNSWLSKVFSCQFVARRILGWPWEHAGRRADAAHVAWLTGVDDSVWAFSDQILAGRIHSSRYYPRGVTAALWLEEHAPTARLQPPPAARTAEEHGPGHAV